MSSKYQRIVTMSLISLPAEILQSILLLYFVQFYQDTMTDFIENSGRRLENRLGDLSYATGSECLDWFERRSLRRQRQLMPSHFTRTQWQASKEMSWFSGFNDAAQAVMRSSPTIREATQPVLRQLHSFVHQARMKYCKELETLYQEQGHAEVCLKLFATGTRSDDAFLSLQRHFARLQDGVAKVSCLIKEHEVLERLIRTCAIEEWSPDAMRGWKGCETPKAKKKSLLGYAIR